MCANFHRNLTINKDFLSHFFGGRYFELPKLLRDIPYPIFLATLQTKEDDHKKKLMQPCPT